VIVEGVATDAEEDLVPLAPVGGQRRVKDDGNQGPDVLDPNGLEMELGDHRIGRVGPRACHSRRGLVGGGDSVSEVDDRLLVGGDEEVVLRLGDLASKSICRSMLAFPSEGGRAYTLLGRCSLSLSGEEGCCKGGVGRSDPGGKGLLARSGGSGPLGIPEEEGDT